ncbi:MAG: DUF5946 family protein [Pseudomonadota bacterium]
MSTEICFSCGAETAPGETGAIHRYMLSSPGCWAQYGVLLAREYSDSRYMAMHALTVDAYAVQHPGVEGPQSTSSVHVHLASLLAYFERDVALSKLPALKQQVVTLKSSFIWLSPPPSLGELNVNSVLAATSPDQHRALVEAWARTAFDAWTPYHNTIRGLLDRLK